MTSAVAPVERMQTRFRLRALTPRAYSNPYLTGILLGLVLLSAYVLMGRGLGASGAFATGAAAAVNTVAPKTAQANHYFSRYLGADGTVEIDWLVLELLGVSIGGLLSALLAGRVRIAVERGPRISQRNRLALAFAGGGIMGLGAVLARGCTSGQALTGGALLSVGSWLFIGGAFGAAYAVAPLLKRAWT
ncbi:MAG TPA: YeeE/YedE thiosulfate transporter family protein [Gemmatimonadaceae bacterium]|nr:YeeE/YedE thiosulfate transporter family protein [Gemmatimonadaceae bacterium]